MNRLPRTGVIIGRFMPPHRGHQYLFDFAAHYVRDLTIFVCSLPEEPIPGPLRYEWVRAMNRDATVVHITEQIPEAERGRPDSYSIWARTIEKHMTRSVDVVFASESYGFELSEALGARFVSVDAGRHVFPISAGRIRTSPYEHWRYIPEIVRPYYVKRIAVLEPRAVGEGAFAHRLADALDTVVVQDYLSYWEGLGLQPETEEDLRIVLSAQEASIVALERHANKILVLAGERESLASDWIDRGFGLPQWYESTGAGAAADHYLLAGLPGKKKRRLVERLASHDLPFDEIDPREGTEAAARIARSLVKPA